MIDQCASTSVTSCSSSSAVAAVACRPSKSGAITLSATGAVHVAKWLPRNAFDVCECGMSWTVHLKITVHQTCSNQVSYNCYHSLEQELFTKWSTLDLLWIFLFALVSSLTSELG